MYVIQFKVHVVYAGPRHVCIHVSCLMVFVKQLDVMLRCICATLHAAVNMLRDNLGSMLVHHACVCVCQRRRDSALLADGLGCMFCLFVLDGR